jgi:hypothetical protein
MIETSIITSTLSRRLIVCGKYVGLGPAATKFGDEVHLLMGGKTPFVLRPVEGFRPPSDLIGKPIESRDVNIAMNGKAYEVIGDCYVHGLMDGDAGLATPRIGR